MPDTGAHTTHTGPGRSSGVGRNPRPDAGGGTPPRLLSGFEAATAVESVVADLIYLTPDVPDPLKSDRGDDSGGAADIRIAASPSDMFSSALGAALTGLRTAGITGSDRAAGVESLVLEAARLHAPALLHLACGPSHDAYTGLGRSGALQFFAASVQEAADLACIARRAAETALVPAICALDRDRTAETLQSVSVPDADVLAAWIGRPSDSIAPATPAQSMLFGDTRHRVPRWLDLDHPVGLGALRGADVTLQADAARSAFFTGHLSSAVDEAMSSFEELTGRGHSRVTPYRMEDADIVVLAQGALTRDLRAAVDHLRSERGIRAGCLALTLFRPFPADLVASMLSNVSAVTILEKSTGTPIELRPIYRDVRVLTDAHVVGRILSGTYGNGRAAPSFEDLCAVYHNMAAGDAARHDFMLGARFEVNQPRLPAVERMQRQLRRAWPALKNRVLASTGASAVTTAGMRTIRIHATPEWDVRSAARLLAEGILDAMDAQVEVRPGHDGRPGDPQIIDIRLPGPVTHRPHSNRPHLGGLLVSHPRLLSTGDAHTGLVRGAVVCIASGLDAGALWATLPSHVRRALCDLQVELRIVDAAAFARQCAPHPRFEMLMAVMGAVAVLAAATTGNETGEDDPDSSARSGPSTSDASAPISQNPVLRAFMTRLDVWASSSGNIGEAIRIAVDGCLTSVESVRAGDLETPPSTDPEPDAPWPLREAATGTGIQTGGEPADAARFWKSVGYPIESGEADHVLADPYIASAAIPARTSAGHRPGALRSSAPVFLPERCTACGTCWSICPDAALNGTVQDTGALLETAADLAEVDGHSVFALRRVLKHVADAAARLAADDELNRFTELGPLFREAWDRVAPRLGLSEDKRSELDEAFTHVLARCKSFPVARTDPFASEGLLLSIAVDVDACTSCGLCVRSCPEDALELKECDEDARERHRLDLALFRELPEVPLESIDAFVRAGDRQKPVYRLLNRQVHDTMLGGEGGAPGDGTRTAVHLVLAAAEAAMQPRVKAFRRELEKLRDGLEERIRDLLADAVQVNDLEALAKRLSGPDTLRVAGTESGGGDHMSLDQVDRLLRGDGTPHTVDRQRLELLARIRTDTADLLAAYERAGHGDGRARVAAAFGTGDASGARSAFPWNPYPFPWIHHLPALAPSLAEGLFEGVRSNMLDAFRTARLARLLVDRTYDAGEHGERLRNLSLEDLTADERRLCPPVIVVVDETGPALDRLLGSRLPIKVLHLDAERYGRDGRDLGRRTPDEPALRAMTAGTAFVLQASASMPDHLLANAERALNFDGPAFMNVHAADPSAHGIPPEHTVESARQAVCSRAFPLFTFDPGRGKEVSERLELSGNPSPRDDRSSESATVLSSTGRLVDATWPVTFADWAVGQGRFSEHFRFSPRPDWHDEMIPVATYVDLADESRDHLQPYVQVPAPDGRISRWIPSGEVILEITRRDDIWNVLREMAGVKSGLADRLRAEADSRAESRIGDETSRLQAALKARLSEELDERERGHAARYHRRLKEELLHLSGFAAEGSSTGKRIRDYLHPSSGVAIPGEAASAGKDARVSHPGDTGGSADAPAAEEPQERDA